MWVPTTDSGTPSTVRSTTMAARCTRSRANVGRCSVRVPSTASAWRVSTAMPQLPRSPDLYRTDPTAAGGRGRTLFKNSAFRLARYPRRGIQASVAPGWGWARRPWASVQVSAR